MSRWLAAAGLGKIDSLAAEIATAAVDVDALLRARQVLREAPSGKREALVKLLAA